MKEITKILSKYIYEINSKEIPDNVIELLKLYIADYFAASFAGYKINSSFNDALSSVMIGQKGREESSVFLHSMKLPAENAAYLNAAYAHGADMDDGNKKSMGHIAAHTMSAVFALAETMDVTWGKIFEAIIAGYEIFNRVAGAAQPGIVKRGFHSTGITGSMASAGACAKLMDLNEKQIYSAMSIAALQASGLFIITESGQECKPLNAANASRTGMFAAKLAAKGIEGPLAPLESRKGWFNAMTETYNEKTLLEGIGQKYTICESYLKPYSSCRHTHYGIECAIALRKKMIAEYGGLNVQAIEQIKMHIYPTAVTVSGTVAIPKSDDQTKFSLHYSLAVALLTGGFGFEYLKASMVSEEIVNLIEKIDIITDDSFENVAAGTRSCRVELYTADGNMLAETVDAPKGDPGHAFTWGDIAVKLYDCSQGLVNREKADELIKSIKNITIADQFAYMAQFS